MWTPEARAAALAARQAHGHQKTYVDHRPGILHGHDKPAPEAAAHADIHHQAVSQHHEAAADHGHKPKLGSGKRFSNLEHKLEHGKKKVHNPGALAAYIGRKKYGAKKFNKLAAKGK